MIQKAAATIIIHYPNKMTKRGRKRVAEWLRLQAKNLIGNGTNYSNVYRANYWYAQKG